ncbi:V-set and immunoglobulin domain-containing protein 10-like [Pholidichthys leucotaenia]
MNKMARCDRTGLKGLFVILLITFSCQGAHSDLVVSPAGPTLVNALSGTSVTLAVSFSGAPDPHVEWSVGGVPIAKWTINSTAPDIDEKDKDVLRLESDGSLTFINVSLLYAQNYTVELSKSGFEKSSAVFILKVFEIIQNVTLTTNPDPAVEGCERFTLQYRMDQGVIEHQKWFYNDSEIKNGSRYLVEQSNLVILGLDRSDSGQYMVLLTNPFSNYSAKTNVKVLYGPDDPTLEAHPAQPFYVSGENVSLSCQAEGLPEPTAEWLFNGQNLSHSQTGLLNLTNVRTSQGGVYTCTVINKETGEKRQNNITLLVYEQPAGIPMCSVQSVNIVDLQYNCGWVGGTPQAQLSFPALNNTDSGAGNVSLIVSASENLNGETVECMAIHPLKQSKCNITASSPAKFLPAVRTTVDSEGKIVVIIQCVTLASPEAMVSWARGSDAITNGTAYQISSDTAQLEMHYYSVSSFLLHNYTCTCHNPLGTQRRQIQLQGPAISDSSLFPNHEGTIITLTWEVPPTSVVTGFDIQMKGPDLLSTDGISKRSLNTYRTIQQKPGSARSADIFGLDPDLTYRFRIIPKARFTDGEPSKVHRIGPGEGLSGPAIAGIAAGIPCSILFLLLLGGLIFLVLYFCRNNSHQTSYPVARVVEKAKTTQPNVTSNNLLSGGPKFSPEYNRLQQTPSERSMDLPTFVPPPPAIRIATTV